jgi:shikimate dehydrogenase
MITGNTKLFCIVADPIKQVKTPQIFNAYLEQEGVDAVLVPAHVKSSDLEDVVSGFRKIKNLAGIIVTVPHKIAVVPMCDNLDESARFVGAVNFIHKDSAGRLIGANFDGSGFANALEGSTGPVEGKAVFIAGAGGVARAIAFNLAKRGASEMRIHNRSEDKSRILKSELQIAFPGLRVELSDRRPTNVDIAVNATSLGLHEDDPLPFDVHGLAEDSVVAEVIMQPPVTTLLSAAKARSLRIVPGDSMLNYQLKPWMEFLAANEVRA